MTALTSEEKKRFLEALKTDEEFRLAVAGLLGLGEILEELRRIHEDIRRLWLKSLEHDKRFEEMNKRFEAIERKLLEHDKRFEEINKRFEAIERKLLEHDKRFESIEKKLLEHDRELKAIREELRIHRRLIEYNRRDIAALTEATISRYVYEDLSEIIKEKREKILYRRRNARVDNVDVDLLVETDKTVYVVEVKIQPNHHDVDNLLQKTNLIAKKYNKPVKPILAAVWIGRETEEYAQNKGIQIVTY